MIYWLLSTGNCRFMKVLRYCAIYCDDIVISCQFSLTVTLFPSYLQRGIYVAGLREGIVASPEQVLDLMEFGECNLFFVHFLYIFFFI